MKILSLLAVLFGLATTPALAASSSGSGRGALSASASIDLQVRIPRVLEMRLLDHPSTVNVTPYDIANGEVVVTGTRLELVSNDRNGYWIAAALRGPFAAATIEGLDAPMHIDSTGGRVLMPGHVGMSRPKPYLVRYHLRLRDGAAPGTYRWPVALSIESP